MNFQIYVEPELKQKIDAICQSSGRKRNAVIREALKEYVDKHGKEAWPDAVFDFRADPKLIRFESLREDFLNDRDVQFGER